jgi:hypothetical protein
MPSASNNGNSSEAADMEEAAHGREQRVEKNAPTIVQRLPFPSNLHSVKTGIGTAVPSATESIRFTGDGSFSPNSTATRRHSSVKSAAMSFSETDLQ